MATINLSDTFGNYHPGTGDLYGITTLQTYLYFMNYPNDSVATKLFVMAIWILDTLHVSLMCHALYYYLISNYGFAPALADGTWSLFPIAVGLSGSESMYRMFGSGILHSQYILSGDEDQVCRRPLRWLVTIPIGNHNNTSSSWFWHRFIKKAFSSFSQLTHYVSFYGNKALARTKRLVNTLVIYAINRCLLTSLVAIAEVVMWSVDNNSSWYMAIDFTIGKLYANSLLASLNTRNYLRGNGSNEGTEANINTIRLSNLPDSSPSDELGSIGTPRTTLCLGTSANRILARDTPSTIHEPLSHVAASNVHVPISWNSMEWEVVTRH
ncbi:hypothetical protein V8B97DRAFT_1918705 [Scleroderma yunnanense]